MIFGVYLWIYKCAMFYISSFVNGLLLALPYFCNGKMWCTGSRCNSDASRTCHRILSTKSYHCACQDGYRQNEALLCEDINECLTPDLCGSSSSRSCVNLPGTYNCNCNPGYQTDNSGVCTDLDECSKPNICGSPSAGQCNNTEGSYTCRCNGGYQLANGICEALSSRSPFVDNLGVIAGAIVGIILIAVVVASLLVVVRRRRRRKYKRNDPPLSNQPIEQQPSHSSVNMSIVLSQENQNEGEATCTSDDGVVDCTCDAVEELYSNKLVKQRKQQQRELKENTFFNDTNVIYANESPTNGAIYGNETPANGAGDPYDAMVTAPAYKQNQRHIGFPDEDTYNQLHQRPLEVPSTADDGKEVNLYNHPYGSGKAPQAQGNPLPGREIPGNDDINVYSIADC